MNERNYGPASNCYLKTSKKHLTLIQVRWIYHDYLDLI